jgi:hypothetical protein
MLEAWQSSEGLMVLDTRYPPLMISTFTGTLDLECVRRHDETATRLVLELATGGKKPICIIDARRVNPPGPQVRKYWASRIDSHSIQLLLATFVVIDSPILRGVLTAIEWLSRSPRRVEWFPTLQEAISVANARLRVSGSSEAFINEAEYRLPPLAAIPAQRVHLTEDTKRSVG